VLGNTGSASGFRPIGLSLFLLASINDVCSQAWATGAGAFEPSLEEFVIVRRP
jgi:hypothetical protein